MCVENSISSRLPIHNRSFQINDYSDIECWVARSVSDKCRPEGFNFKTLRGGNPEIHIVSVVFVKYSLSNSRVSYNLIIRYLPQRIIFTQLIIKHVVIICRIAFFITLVINVKWFSILRLAIASVTKRLWYLLNKSVLMIGV